MSSFDEREQAFEKKFERDQELAFKLRARRNKLLGLWAAERMALKGDAAAAYAGALVQSDLTRPGDAALITKVAADLAQRGLEFDEARIRAELERCAAEAKRQLGAPA